MNFLGLLLMVGAGAGIAVVVVMINAAVNRRDARAGEEMRAGRDEIEAKILKRIAASLGEKGTRPSIDLTSWGAAYARIAGTTERLDLLHRAVEAARSERGTITLEQYRLLIELCFSLGFHADAFARAGVAAGVHLETGAFRARPTRSRGPALFERGEELEEHLGRLGLSRAELSRQTVTSAYRRLAAQLHPDRFHGASEADQERAAIDFMNLHSSYEYLLRQSPFESEP